MQYEFSKNAKPGSMCRYVLIKVQLCLAGFKKKSVVQQDVCYLFHSPFKVMSQPGHDASKVRASGPGLDTKGVSASLPVEFTIDARDAGEGLLTVQILVGSANFHTIRF